MKYFILVIALLLISTSCNDSKKDKEMTAYEKVMLFKEANPIGEKLGFGGVILDSVIIYGDDNVDSVQVCFSKTSCFEDFDSSISAIANWKNGELLDSLYLRICNYRNINGEKGIIDQSSFLYNNKNWVVYKDCRNPEHLRIMSDVLASNKTFPQQLDEVTTLDSLKYSPDAGIYIYHYTLSGVADNAAHDYKKISSKMKEDIVQKQKLLIENSTEISDFYNMLEKQKVLIKYEYYSASTAKCLFSFSMTPVQLLKY